MCDVVGWWWTLCGPLAGATFVVSGADGVRAEGLTADDGRMCVDGLEPGDWDIEVRTPPDAVCPVAVSVHVPNVPRTDDVGRFPLPTWDRPEPWAGVPRWERFERAWERAGGEPDLRDWSTCDGDLVHVVSITHADRRPRRWELRSALVCSDPSTWSITRTRWSTDEGRFVSATSEVAVQRRDWLTLLQDIADDGFVLRPQQDPRGDRVVLVELVGVAELWRVVPPDAVPDWVTGLLGE